MTEEGHLKGGAEEGEVTEATTDERTLHQTLHQDRGPDENFSTLGFHQSQILGDNGLHQATILLGSRQHEMRGLLFGHQEVQMEVEEEVLGLHGEVLKKVDFGFYLNYHPPPTFPAN